MNNYRLLSGVTLFFFLSEVFASMDNSKKFESIFQYELNNRAFAYISVIEISKRKINTEQADFWQAYARLEKFSQPRYLRVSKKYNLEVNLLLVKIKAWFINLAFLLFPQKMLEVMTEATIEYVNKLRPLIDLARAEDRGFFEYVLAQEQAQANALSHASKGNFDIAANELTNFLEGQK